MSALLASALTACGGAEEGKGSTTSPAPAPAPPGPPTGPGTAAALGKPSSTAFNGLPLVQDTMHRVAKHALNAVPGVLPAALTPNTLPYLPNIKVLSRRDAVILYLPNIAGAADYRAYAVTSGVSYTNTANGQQPRGAVIACAGYRLRAYDLELAGAPPWREVLQAVELPGLKKGNYTIVVEATQTPCPFTGMSAHTDSTLTATDPTVLNSKASLVSFNTVRARYGNEFVNGQGSATSWADRNDMRVMRGQPVPPDRTEIPKDPVVLARSVISMTLPAADEAVNAPIIDVGPNAVFDDFSTDLVVDPANVTHNQEFGDPWVAMHPLATIPGAWTFWGWGMQHADGESAKRADLTGFQVFQRHGRLYHTGGDNGQCCMSGTFFSSLKTLPLELENTKYAHSFFRVNSDATDRRYWTWMMCGAANRNELVDPTTRMPISRPLTLPGFFGAGGKNPTARHGSEPDSATRYDKECLLLVQQGIGEPHWPSTFDSRPRDARSANRMVMVLHPKGTAAGAVAYGPGVASDWWSKDFAGWTWRVDAKGQYAGPMMEPFDQVASLTHFDIFVRPDRVVVFINGRQAMCSDISQRPLEMKYGLVMYGNTLYHSAAEQTEAEGSSHILDHTRRLNTPIADTRAWDAVGHSEHIDIPSQLAFDPGLCLKPSNIAMQ